jgi:hypothetical protein
MTHLYYNWDLGYEQVGEMFDDASVGNLLTILKGLNDLLSPILVVMEGDEAKAFWCFAGLVEMLKSNFEVTFNCLNDFRF